MKLLLVLMTMLVAWADTVMFQGRSYRLGSFNQKANVMWEFVSAPKTVNNWTTLLTMVDRPDAKTVADMDRLAQGVTRFFGAAGVGPIAAVGDGSDERALASMPETTLAREGLAPAILEMSGPTTLSAACSCREKTLRFKDDGGFAKRGDRCLV